MQGDIPIAAICGATTFPCKYDFLTLARHTEDNLEVFQRQVGYEGQAFYVAAQAVVDRGFITVNETAAVGFAYEILKVDSDDEMAEWYDNFKRAGYAGSIWLPGLLYRVSDVLHGPTKDKTRPAV